MTETSDARPAMEGAHAPHADTCSCGHGAAAPATPYIYALGKIHVRFPSLALEREFQQREREMPSDPDALRSTGARVAAVLRANPHLSRAVCYVHQVGGLPAYVVAPVGMEVRDALVDAVGRAMEPDTWSIVIGRRGPMATPTTCGGLLAPLVACDQIYTFTVDDLVGQLSERLAPALAARKLTGAHLRTAAEDIFRRVAGSLENLGALDGHRALNYFLVQHPGLFLAAAERIDRAILDSVETRVGEAAMGNRVVTVILSFIDRATGVADRLFTRIDVTEEWPFVADVAHAAAAPLGLAPFVDTGPAVPVA